MVQAKRKGDVVLKERSLLILGACTVSGYGLPATLSLPVLISRAFRKQHAVSLRIEAENHLGSLDELSQWLDSGRFPGPYDCILMQSMIGRETIPQLGIAERFDRPGMTGWLYRRLRTCFDSPDGHSWINRLRSRFGYTRSSGSRYEEKLSLCLQQLRRSSPAAKVLLLGQAPAMAGARGAFRKINQQNRQLLLKLASAYDYELIDLFPVLTSLSPKEIFQADGLHFTARGQTLVAQTIVERLWATGVAGKEERNIACGDNP